MPLSADAHAPLLALMSKWKGAHILSVEQFDEPMLLELFGVATFAELRPHLAAWTHETYPLIAKIDAFYVSNRLQP